MFKFFNRTNWTILFNLFISNDKILGECSFNSFNLLIQVHHLEPIYLPLITCFLSLLMTKYYGKQTINLPSMLFRFGHEPLTCKINVYLKVNRLQAIFIPIDEIRPSFAFQKVSDKEKVRIVVPVHGKTYV